MRGIVIGKRLGDVGVTSTETRPSWSDRLNPRNWSLAWKLVAVGLVPALLAIVLGVLRVADQAETASNLGAANRSLEIRNLIADAADALRVERDQATAFVAERRLGDRGPLEEAIGRTDAAYEQARVALAEAGDIEPTTRTALEEAEGGFAQLSTLRGEVTGSAQLEPSAVIDRYTFVIARADVLARALLLQQRTTDGAGLADAVNAATASAEALARQHTVVGAALRVGRITLEDRAAINATDSAMTTGYSFYKLALPPSEPPVNYITSREKEQLDAAKVTILNAPAPGPLSVTVAEWDDAARALAAQIDAARTGARTALVAAGEAAEDRSSNLAGINSVILMLGLLLAATIIVLVSRALTRSLRVLRSSALDVADRRLPQAVESIRSGSTPEVTAEPVPLRTRDEVGQVARAFDAVHGQALRLAADQAALQSNVSSMFVNLSRRSQALVERQLQLIEQLESNEQDPDQLSNLFQLDHLATRMRRNSENLLVLAGTDLAKRNVAPVPLVDVLRAAVSEIEQYQRIVVQAPPLATVVGRATNDIVHLLAELLDNATNFSPPDTQVVMSSMRNPDGSITVEIADRGVGMNDLELDDVNRRLSTPSTVDVSTSRRMGLFVVGRLGARHGIAVHLGGAPAGRPGGGLTAAVTLPVQLVTSTGGDGWAAAPPGTQPAVGPNGVTPQRPSRMLPAGAGAVPPGREEAAQRTGPPAVNGLPTRTPGSSLRPAVAAVHAHAPEVDDAGAKAEPAADQALTAPVPETAPAPEPEAAVTAQPTTLEPDTPEPHARLDGGHPHGDESEEARRPPSDATADDHRIEDDVPDDTADEPTGRVAIQHADEPTGEVTTDHAAHEPTREVSAEEAVADVERVDEERGDKAESTDEIADEQAGVQSEDDTPTEHIPQDRADDGARDDAVEEPVRPNGATRGQPVPPVPYEVAREGPDGTGQGGEGQADADGGAGPGHTPHTTPLPVLNGEQLAPATVAAREDDAEALFTPRVPVGTESDGLPRSRRPVAEMRRGSLVDPNETTPIFEEIASAWFAANRPVPVDWELGERQEAEADADESAAPAEPVPAKAVWTAPPQSTPRDEAPAESRQPVDEDFASVADEGWRAASGAAAERPDELTAAGLPKRRPRARLVPGSAGSAVLAAPAGSTRSAESTRARLASYQQGVRQGREVRLRRGPAGSGPQPVVDGDNGADPAGDDHDEESR